MLLPILYMILGGFIVLFLVLLLTPLIWRRFTFLITQQLASRMPSSLEEIENAKAALATKYKMLLHQKDCKEKAILNIATKNQLALTNLLFNNPEKPGQLNKAPELLPLSEQIDGQISSHQQPDALTANKLENSHSPAGTTRDKLSVKDLEINYLTAEKEIINSLLSLMTKNDPAPLDRQALLTESLELNKTYNNILHSSLMNANKMADILEKNQPMLQDWLAKLENQLILPREKDGNPALAEHNVEKEEIKRKLIMFAGNFIAYIIASNNKEANNSQIKEFLKDDTIKLPNSIMTKINSALNR